jgi:hypothetical protein
VLAAVVVAFATYYLKSNEHIYSLMTIMFLNINNYLQVVVLRQESNLVKEFGKECLQKMAALHLTSVKRCRRMRPTRLLRWSHPNN